jgi:hypothetical protein
VIVEAKLYSGKSGTGEDDQLVRYLRLLAHLEDMDLGAAKRDIRFLVYLTPRDSTREIKESLDFIRAENDPQNFQNRIFSLQWQDILETAQRVAGSAEDPTKMILTDVAKFLKQRKLEYFVGFDLAGNLDGIEGIDGAFYGSKLSGGSVFTGMARFQSLSWFAISSGEWM